MVGMAQASNDQFDVSGFPPEALAAVRSRLQQPGHPVDLTVGDETLGVVLSPTEYEKLRRTDDLAKIQRAEQQITRGETRDAFEFFDELRAKLMDMKKQAG